MTRHFRKIVSATAVLLGAALFLGGCESTHQSQEAKASGFLKNYSQLRPGGEGEALWVYRNPAADFSRYNKIALEPARLYATPDGDFSKMSKEDQQRLVNYLHAAVFENLKGDYTFVTQNGPGVMRLRIAITEAKGANVALDTMSTLLPPSIVASEIKRLATGTPMAVGKAGAEAELVDGQTGVRLAAAVDRRFGEKITGNMDKFDKYRAVTDSFDYWAKKLKDRLAEWRTTGASSQAR